jgi:hypothetical protein
MWDVLLRVLLAIAAAAAATALLMYFTIRGGQAESDDRDDGT